MDSHPLASPDIRVTGTFVLSENAWTETARGRKGIRYTERESAEPGLENKRLKRGSCRQKRVPVMNTFSPFLSWCRVTAESSKRSLLASRKLNNTDSQMGYKDWPRAVTTETASQSTLESRRSSSALLSLLGYTRLAWLCLARDTLAWSSVHDQDRLGCSSAQPYISS